MTSTFAHQDASSARMPAAAALELTGRSPAICRVVDLLHRAAGVETAVLLVGEKGTDLPAVARDLHGWGAAPMAPGHDAPAPFVELACADSPNVERDLFGTTHGAPGDLDAISPDSRLAAARGGTLFLHEITELPSGAQARLARVLRDREVRLRGERVATACRIVAGAAPAIDEDVHAQRFRADLYRRLSATRIDLPPLRDRAGDVSALAARILAEIAGAEEGRPRAFTQAALALLGAMPWLGNLAELREVVARSARASNGDVLQIEHVLPVLQLDRQPAAFVPTGSLRDARLRFERDYIAAVLQHHGWRMADAAQTLGIQRPNLYRKARQLGIPIVGIE